MSTKSGTNSWRGTGYEYFRNDAMDSIDDISKRAGAPRPRTSRTSTAATSAARSSRTARWDIFNLFNTVNYGLPNRNISDAATFGTISSLSSDARIMQIAVRFTF